ncbi:aminoacyl-tRNA deacylase [Paenibacillus cremeus]|uniref:YbaK/aminoacyl-tRNA synthetase-associated domain-containing protein n=1 Tax=Paenibacillus cremeus TaxID=2163881 RepID=A0A559KF86_9BACL|nr:YbaK/EbsC family protein [Paenibacillus cremeus]TVY10781.1 hypothetical protein FPZ49_06695 [Paenibacillus cremeus]
MDNYDLKIKAFMAANDVQAEHLRLNQSCHTVKEAAEAVGASTDQLVKNICMIDQEGRMIVAIVNGDDRASTTRVSKALGIEAPRLAEEHEVLAGTGYPPGGVPSFGYPALFLMDAKIEAMDEVYTGGGSPNSLIKISVSELVRANQGTFARVRK